MKRLAAILTPLHRYLGLLFCLVFAAWFASGLVMIYARMPAYDPANASRGWCRSTRAPFTSRPHRRWRTRNLASRPSGSG